jgi:hypothetical protein
MHNSVSVLVILKDDRVSAVGGRKERKKGPDSYHEPAGIPYSFPQSLQPASAE